MRRLSLKLSLYLTRRFFLSYLAVLAVLVGLGLVKDLVHYGQKAVVNDAITFAIVLELSVLRIPQAIELMTPLAILAGGMIAMWRLTRYHELVAIRSAGVSIWQFLAPAIVVALLIGGFNLVILNPLAADSVARHNLLHSTYIRPKGNIFNVSAGGAWLREVDRNGATVIHADRAISGNNRVELRHVTVLLFDENGDLGMRIDADEGSLEKGHWHLVNTVSRRPGEREEAHEFFDLQTKLTLDRLQEGSAEPESVPFWRLPEVIKLTEDAGFTAVRYRIHWNALLASPLLLCAMILIATSFSLRMPRQGGTITLIIAGIVAGFVIELLKYVMVTLGNFGEVPVLLAAWTPAAATLMIGVAALIQIEDG